MKKYGNRYEKLYLFFLFEKGGTFKMITKHDVGSGLDQTDYNTCNPVGLGLDPTAKRHYPNRIGHHNNCPINSSTG